MLRASAPASLCPSFPLLLLLRRFGIKCKSKSCFLFGPSQSHPPPSSSSPSSYFTDGRALFLNSIPNARTIDAFRDVYKEMLRMEPLPPSKDFALLFGSAVEMRYYLLVISFIQDLRSSSAVVELDVNIMNILINCFCQLKFTDLGSSNMGSMFKIGLKPNELTLTTLINGLCEEGKVDQAIKLSQHMERREHQLNKSEIIGFDDELGDTSSAFNFYRIIVNALCQDRFRVLPEALRLCLEMTKKGVEPTLVTYNCLFEGLCKSGRWNEASTLLIFMLQIGIMPDAETFNVLAHALSREGMVSGVKIIMSLMIRTGLQPDKVTFTALIYGYSLQNQINEAMEAFDLMVEGGCLPDIVTYNLLIYGFCKTNNIHRAADLISEMLHINLLPDTVTWNTFIHGCFRAGNSEAALEMGKRLPDYEYSMFDNEYTHNIMLDGLFKCGLDDDAKRTFRFLDSNNCCDIVSCNIMLYGMCRERNIGQLNDAWELFSLLPAEELKFDAEDEDEDEDEDEEDDDDDEDDDGDDDDEDEDEDEDEDDDDDEEEEEEEEKKKKKKKLKRDVYSYAIMIKGLCLADRLDDAEELLINMEQNGCLPTGIAYHALVQGFLVGHDIARAIKYLEIIKDKGFSVDATAIDELIRSLKNM